MKSPSASFRGWPPSASLVNREDLGVIVVQWKMSPLSKMVSNLSRRFVYAY